MFISTRHPTTLQNWSDFRPAHRGPQRRAPPRLARPHASHLLPRTIPVRDSPCLAGLVGNQHGSQGRGAVLTGGGHGATPSRTQARPAEVPGTTPSDPMRARCRTLRIGLGTGKIVRLPVVDPFPHISVHVEKAPGVGRILTHIAGLFKIVSEVDPPSQL